MDLIALLPWWGGLAAAVAFYFLFHGLASPPSPAALQPGKTGVLIQATLIAGVASIAQYFVPFLCLIAACVSFMRRRKRSQLLQGVAESGEQNSLNGMSWREFEMLVGEAFRMEGYSVAETGGGGADGGVDLILRKADATYLVQCKQWKALTVPVSVVRELYGVMVHHKARGAFVVSSGRFTADAQAFAQGKGIELIDGAALVARVRRSRAAQPGAAPMAAQVAAQTPPACPLCSSTMVRRTARKGAQAGSQFWGCSRFPACRGVR